VARDPEGSVGGPSAPPDATFGITEPDPELRAELLRAMISMLGDALALELEDLLMAPLPIPDSPIYKRIVETLEARGETRGEARTLLRVLASRGIDLDERTRALITACTDVAQLDRWVDRAALATTLDEVFATSHDAE